MQIHRALLCLLVAIGLVAAPGIRRPGVTGDEPVQSWRDLGHVPLAVARAAQVEVPTARADDDEAPRTQSGGDGPSGAQVAPRAGSGAVHGQAVVRRAGTLDARVLLALPHLRVNGCADAFGARA